MQFVKSYTVSEIDDKIEASKLILNLFETRFRCFTNNGFSKLSANVANNLFGISTGIVIGEKEGEREEGRERGREERGAGVRRRKGEGAVV